MYWILDTDKINREVLMKEAEQERLAQALIESGEAVTYNPTLAWVGHRMMAIGLSLVKLAGDTEERPNPPADLN